MHFIIIKNIDKFNLIKRNFKFINNMNNEECNIKILDEIYKDINNIDFIKIDVEGYEHYVLSKKFKINKFKPYLLIEVR
jgi:FkbM family methyltransferase